MYSQFLQLLELGKRVLFNFCDWIVVQMSEIINGLIFSVVKLLSLLYIQLTISFLIGRKRIVNFRNQRLGRHLAADYTIIMSRTLKVLDFSGSSLQVHAFCVACWFVYFYTFRNKLSVPLTIVTNFFFAQCIIKQLLYSVFCDIQNNQGLCQGYQRQASALVDNPCLDLDYSGYHKNLFQ